MHVLTAQVSGPAGLDLVVVLVCAVEWANKEKTAR